MTSSVSTRRLALASARHPWRAIGLWIGFLALAIILAATLLDGAMTTETTLTNNPESAQGDELLSERLPETRDTINETVIVRSESQTVDESGYRSFVEQLYGELVALGEARIAGGTHYYQNGDASLVSADRRTTLIPLILPDAAREDVGEIHQVLESAASGSTFQVLATGQATLDAEITKVAERDLAKGEAIGLSAALVILALVLGAVAAAFLPIVLAIAAITVALGAAALVGQFIDLPFFIMNVMTMMGLAVGIDYSLFIVSRFREERARGRDKLDAIATAGATAGRTVVISGVTVALALAGLLVTPDSANQMIGLGALLVVAAAVLASMTLLPALLGLLGDRINALTIPFVKPTYAGLGDPGGAGFWTSISRAVMRRPVVSLVLAGGLLLAAASAYLDIEQGEIGVSSLPQHMMSAEAFAILEAEFGFGQDQPAVIAIDGQTSLASVETAIAALDAAIAADSAFVGTTREAHSGADLTIVHAWLAGDPASPEALEAVERLRSDYVPRAFADAPANVLVTGYTARLVDLNDVNETYTPIVVALVLSLSFVFLTIAFRSIVIPIKAIAMNLLSVAAAYGLLVLVFQKGVGADLFGFQQVDVIQTGLPLFLFAILFGLSMDYHVFLLSRVRERYLQTGDNNDAVAYGLQSTGRLITGAALIMVAVFGGFALGDLVAMQQFGFGLAVAVLLDATIVRCVLVPASMRLLGTWNWYLPDFLHWLPELRVETPDLAPSGVAGD